MEGGGGWRRGGKEWESFACWTKLEDERGAEGGGAEEKEERFNLYRSAEDQERLSEKVVCLRKNALVCV